MRQPAASIRPRPRSAEAAAAPPRPASVPLAAAVVAWVAIAVAIALLMLWYLALSRRAAGRLGFPLDDSWIHVRFAQNLAAGRGFSFNPGEPTGTTTGVLWTLLLAAGYRLSHHRLFTPIAINWALCLLLCAAVYALTLEMVHRPWVGLAAAATAAVTVPLPWWALSGMEPPLYGALALLGIVLHLCLRRVHGVRSLLPTAAFALAGLARPECFLLFPLALLDRLAAAGLADRSAGWARRWAVDAAIQIPVFAAIAAPVFIYNVRVTGYPLPTSFYSKLQWMSVSGAAATQRTSALLYVLAAAPAKELWDVLKVWTANNALLLPGFAAGLLWLVREAVASRGRRGSLLIPAVLVVQPAVWALVAGYRPPGFQSQRYLANLNPLYLVLGVVGGWWVTERLAVLRRPAVRGALAAAVLVLSLLRQPAGALTYATNVKNITEMQVATAQWLRDHTAPGSLLAVNDVGAIGVISDRRVLDLQGLVTPEILSRRDLEHRMAGTAPEAVFEFIAERQPDYLVIFPNWYPELDARRDLFTPVFEVHIQNNITCGSDLMRVYRTAWSTHRSGS